MDWYFDLSKADRAAADAFLENMRKSGNWKMPDYRPALHGSADLRRLGELRWESSNVQHRLVGYLEGDTFFMMIGCTHKQRRYDPSSALDTAVERRKQVENREASTNEFNP